MLTIHPSTQQVRANLTRQTYQQAGHRLGQRAADIKLPCQLADDTFDQATHARDITESCGFED